MPVEVTITNEEQVELTATPTTRAGKPATLDGPLRVSVISGNGTFVQDPAEPNSVMLVSGDDPGDTSYLIEADADLGAGEVLIQDTAVVHVEGALASALGLSVGAPEPK